MTDRPRALAVLIAVFLVGCIAGAAGSYYWLSQNPEVRSRHGENGPPGSQGRQRLPELLQLTPEQDARFKEIMMDSRKQLDQLRKELAPLQSQMDAKWQAQIPKLDAIRADTNRKISAILNPEQQKKFDALLKEWDTFRQHQPRGRDFGPPPR